MSKLRVLLVTTWETDCGIAEHAAMLKKAVTAAHQDIDLYPDEGALDPNAARGAVPMGPDLIHLNYHAALHSRWTPAVIRAQQVPVVVTYHDTGVPNSEQCKGVIEAAAAAVVHEPFDDLPADKTHYWRMGVPDWVVSLHIDRRTLNRRPLLGTCGFPFPWKNYDELCRVTREAGWALLLIAPRATEADVARWEKLQPHLIVYSEFLKRRQVIALLTACDASAFLYTCANTGQSGAICMGIAARKPVLAFEHCRQFRALRSDPLGESAIRWCEDWDEVAKRLQWLPIQRCDPATVALAEQDSWARLGKQYAALYRSLL